MGTLGLMLTLVVRLYDNGALTGADRAAVVATASEILFASNIPTSWPECTAPRPQPKAADAGATAAALVCERPMGPGDVAVRVVRAADASLATRHSPVVTRQSLPLGYALIDGQRQRGTLATIYLDRVAWIAADAGIDVRIVLARAIAHEIGHLLLGTNAHSSRGLMRALWSRQALERNHAADWRFSPRETATLQRAMLRALEEETWALSYHDVGF